MCVDEEINATRLTSHASTGLKECVSICACVGHTFYLILSGVCKVTLNQSDDNDAKTGEKILGFLHADQYFGEVECLRLGV